jgi:hypothetical protein
MKRNLEPNNPYAEVGSEIAMLLMTLHEASVEKLKHSKQSEQWKEGYENAISTVIIAFSEAYLPTLKDRSDKWENASNNLFKQNFETN